MVFASIAPDALRKLQTLLWLRLTHHVATEAAGRPPSLAGLVAEALTWYLDSVAQEQTLRLYQPVKKAKRRLFNFELSLIHRAALFAERHQTFVSRVVDNAVAAYTERFWEPNMGVAFEHAVAVAPELIERAQSRVTKPKR
jgi:hypothetical protein